MKKRLITILSLILAFVLCFALVACGGDNTTSPSNKPNKPNKPSGSDDPEPEEPSVPSVSITLNQALDVIDEVLSVQGFTGTASYTLSTKNTETLTESVALDKRGNKIKVTAGNDEYIVDIATGYVYNSGENGYTYDHVLNANVVGYVQYVIDNLDDTTGAKDIKAVYDEENNTLTYVVEKSESVNAYLEPLQSAYKKNKNIGMLLDDYCKLLFGKKFDAMYKVFEGYIKDSKNTVGTVLEALKAKGLDVEAILEMTGNSLPKDQMNAIKARPLNNVVAGAYKYLMSSFGGMLPMAEAENGGEGTSVAVGGGMKYFAFELLNAALFEKVTEAEVKSALDEIYVLLNLAKSFGVKTLIDTVLKDIPKAADLYTVIKDGVTLKNATITVTVKVDDNKKVKGVKVVCSAAHTYDGKAAEGLILADNDYLASAEITIDEYKTSTEDFVIALDPACDYKMPVTALLYEVTDKSVSVYYETAGKTVNVSSYFLEVESPDGKTAQITDAAKDAFKFDAATSSFVFDGALVKTALGDAAFGTKLHAYMIFDSDENGYAVTLMYVNADIQALYDYARESAVAFVQGYFGGSSQTETPNIDAGQAA